MVFATNGTVCFILRMPCTPCDCAASSNGPLARYVKLRVAHGPGMPGTFPPPPRVSDTDMHHGTCVTHVPWCMPGSLTSGFLWNRWRGKRSRHSRRMRNLAYLVRGPLTNLLSNWFLLHSNKNVILTYIRWPGVTKVVKMTTCKAPSNQNYVKE